MNYKSRPFNVRSVGGESRRSFTTGCDDNTLADLMTNPEYLRHSSAVINEALKEGFDVLQLPNGDIVTTGTKTIVHTYIWDAGAARLDKSRATNDRPRSRKVKAEQEETAE